MKLGLGSAQFGSHYGISNFSGKTEAGEVEKILEVAKHYCIDTLDTAFAYGEAERILGEKLDPHHVFHIVTKTPIFSDKKMDLKEIFQQSLERLKQPSLYGLLFHRAEDLLDEKGGFLYEQALHLKEEGLIKKIGVSVYSPDQIELIVENYRIDLIQLPINILDQRLIKNGYLRALKKESVEIHARSVFLQGLLLMNVENLPSYFENIRSKMKSYREKIAVQQWTSVEAALGFVLGIPEVDRVICGVENHKQLQELCKVKALDGHYFADFSMNEESFINPSEWVL